jgi:hypothetical protein
MSGDRGFRVNSASGDADARDPAVIKDVFERYQRNKVMAEAAARYSGVAVAFVWLPRAAADVPDDWRRAHYGYSAVEEAFEKGLLGDNFVMCRNNDRLYYPPTGFPRSETSLFQSGSTNPNALGAHVIGQCVAAFLRSRKLLPEAPPS